MPMQPPNIDHRTIQAIIDYTAKLAETYAGWRPASNGRPDTGQALIRIFARMLETLITRLNQVPQKNLLAFLDMIGTRILPPQPARVPLTFTLATGSNNDALVPARTQVIATPIMGDPGPVLFETETDLVVTRTRLVALLTREPARDRYTDYSANMTSATAAPVMAFYGEQPLLHRMFLGYDQLLTQDTDADISLQFSPYPAAAPWLQRIAWSYWNGTTWQPLDALAVTLAQPDAAPGEVILRAVPPIAPSSLNNRTSAWLCATLTTSLPRGELRTDATGVSSEIQQQGILPEAAFSAQEEPDAKSERRDVRQVVYPFGIENSFPFFYLAAEIAFAKPGAQVMLALEFDTSDPVQPEGLLLAWEYWDGQAWKELGRSNPDPTADNSAADFADETHAFTHDGDVRFVCPTDWSTHELFDAGSMYWLRVRIARGRYSTVGNNRPPAIRHLTLGYIWPLPRIETIQTQVNIAKSGLFPVAAFTNQTPVDLTRDFLPFGPEPAFNTTFYLANDEVFTKPGASVTLQIRLTHPADQNGTPAAAQPSDDLCLRWEFWNGTQWELLGESGSCAQLETPQPNDFADETDQFAYTGTGFRTVTFTCPATLQPTSVNGLTHAWLRVRIARGNYGRPASYRLKVADKPEEGYLLTPASFRPPSIAALTLDYGYTSPLVAPDQILSENDFVLIDQGQAARTPATPFTPFTPPVDTRPGLYLGFQRPGAQSGFANRTSTLYFGVAEVLYAETATTPAATEAASVVWEYWNGRDWSRLGTRDETRSLTRRGLLTFIGPEDFRRSCEFDREAFWLRARWDRGSYSTLPRLQHILTNTIWATHTLTIQNEELGSSNGEPDQVFRTTRAPLLLGQRIEVREPEMPAADEQVPVGSSESGAVWVPWHEVLDFFASGSRSRHYVIDHLTGELRFGDGRYGMIPPRGRANIRVAWYQTGGGAYGNRPENSITQLGSTVPFVDQVRNPEPASGGADQEGLEEVVQRGPRLLRHRNRAVALSDYEDLAFAATSEVARVRCLPADSDRMVEAARRHTGTVRLIIVPRSSATRPIPSLELLARVQDALEARLLPTVDLHVQGPAWLEVTVSAEVAPVMPEAANDVQTAILSRLAAFLHPLTGGTDGQGWEFGRRPYRSDLYALIENTPGVSYVRQLEVETTGVVQPERFLVYSGHHRITMFSEDL